MSKIFCLFCSKFSEDGAFVHDITVEDDDGLTLTPLTLILQYFEEDINIPKSSQCCESCRYFTSLKKSRTDPLFYFKNYPFPLQCRRRRAGLPTSKKELFYALRVKYAKFQQKNFNGLLQLTVECLNLREFSTYSLVFTHEIK